MRFVVTGNMGCGKSTVVGMLREMLPSHRLFDFDRAVHNLYQDPTVILMLMLEFNTSDRRQISDIVHADPVKMKRLGEIMNASLLHQLQDACVDDDVILDVPLWFEILDARGDRELEVDGVVCVTCQPEKQRNRIRSRNGFSDEKIDAILSKQLPQDVKASRSQYVIDNSGTLDDLRAQVVRFIQKGFNND